MGNRFCGGRIGLGWCHLTRANKLSEGRRGRRLLLLRDVDERRWKYCHCHVRPAQILSKAVNAPLAPLDQPDYLLPRRTSLSVQTPFDAPSMYRSFSFARYRQIIRAVFPLHSTPSPNEVPLDGPTRLKPGRLVGDETDQRQTVSR